MNVFPSGAKGFFLPVYQGNLAPSKHSFTNRVREAVDSYLSPLNYSGLQGKIIKKENVVQLEKADKQPFYKLALKVASYALIIPFLVAIAIKYALRKEYVSVGELREASWECSKLRMKLEAWRDSLEIDTNPDKDSVFNIIKEFVLNSKLNTLDLSNARVENLPDIFDHEIFASRLEFFEFKDSSLKYLPENLNLPALIGLGLCNTQVRSFPANYNLPVLKKLNLANTPLESLPKNFNLPALELLLLQDTQLKSLPNPLNLPVLKGLDLTNTPLESFPANFSLPVLKELSLANTPIESLPENFNLPSLELLILRNTQMRSLPENYNLPVLQQLVLKNTPLESLPENFNLPALEVLNLEESQLESFPSNFSLPVLQQLGLENTPIESLPENFNLPSLELLLLQNTQMRSFPSNFSLPVLQQMSLANTPIESLPENFNLPALKKLSMENTRLKKLPENFNLPVLQQMSLANTPIESLPENFNLPALKKLSMENTRLKKLPVNLDLPSLELLILQKTLLQTLPEHLNLPALKILNLEDTPLKSFPTNPNLPALKELNLKNTPLESLPENFNLPALEVLNLEESQLESLPANLNLPNLIDLFLKETPLQNWPANFNLPALESLGLRNTELQSLPENCIFPALKRLDLAETQLENWPQNLELPALETLCLYCCRIRSLPENFNYPRLTTLELGGTLIRSVPSSLGFSRLMQLGLSGTQLSSLPESIFTMPRGGTIYLTQSNLPQRVAERIQQRVSADGYEGPSVMINQEANIQIETTFEEALSMVLNNVEDKENLFDELKTLPENDHQKNSLRVWLARLFETASANSDTSVSFMKMVVEILKKSKTDPEFKTLFFLVIEEAIDTCGDRIALSVMQLDVQKQLKQLSVENPKTVYDFLTKTVYSLSFLEQRASNLELTLQYTDPLEIYLALPIVLKQQHGFDIQINVDELLFESCSGLKPEDYDSAAAELIAHLDDEEMMLDFIIGQDKWLEALRSNKREQLDRAEEKRVEACEDPSKVDEAQAEYRKTLKELSKALLLENDE